MASGLLSLKWNNHRSTIFHKLSTLQNKECYSDVTLACNGKFYSLHKFVLSMCSDYFEEIFLNAASKNLVIVLKDIKCDELEALLNYMYVGEVNVMQEKLSGLIKAAECLKIKGLAVPEEDFLDETEKAKDVGREHNKRPQRHDDGPRERKRRREHISDGIEDIHSPVKNQSSSSGKKESQKSHRTSSETQMDIEDKDAIAPKEFSAPNTNYSSHRRRSAQEEVDYVDVDAVKPEPLDLDIIEEELNAEDTKASLHQQLGFTTEDSVAGQQNDFDDKDQAILDDETQNNADDDIAGSSGLQDSSEPIWLEEGSVSNFSTESFSGDQPQDQQMILDPELHIFTHQLPDLAGFCEETHDKHSNEYGIQPQSNTTSKISSNLRTADTQLEQHLQPFSFSSINESNLTQNVSSHFSNTKSFTTDGTGSALETTAKEPITTVGHGIYRTYNCNVCSYKSNIMTNIKQHTRTHTGEKPFQCQYCPYKGATIGNLRSHVMHRHADKFRPGSV